MDYVEILRLGLIGLSFLLAFLAFRLLLAEQRRSEVRNAMFVATYVFMIFAIVMSGFALTEMVMRNKRAVIREQKLPTITWSFNPTGPVTIQCTANGKAIGAELNCATLHTCTDGGVNYDQANTDICAGKYYVQAITEIAQAGRSEQ